MVKQIHLERDELLEFEYCLKDVQGNPVQRAIELDDLEFVASPVGNVDEFDPREAFEMHFVVTDLSGLKFASQFGFYRDISIWERALRRAVRKYFKAMEEKEGKPFDPTLHVAQPDVRYSGNVIQANEHFIAVARSTDIEQVSLHRIQKLDQSPKVGDSVTIRYHGKKGVVTHVKH